MEHDLGVKIALIAAFGVGAQWLAWRLRLPAILLLAVAGVVAGPGLGWLDPHEDFGHLLQPFVGAAVAIILFEGGLNLELRELRAAGTAVRRLMLPGVPLAWLFGTLAAHYLAGLDWPVALLFGAILVVTGPTVVIPLLRQGKLAREPATILKWEGILNDPVCALLAVLVFELVVAPSGEELGLLPGIGLGIAVAAVVGVGLGLGFTAVLRRGWMAEYLKLPVLIALVLVGYAAGNALQEEAGLLTTTLMGVTLANTGLASLEQFRRFKESIGVLLVSALFVVLSATLRPEMLAAFDLRTAAFLLALLFLVRPAAVWLATIRSGLDWRTRLFLGWIAPRGIVAVAITGVFASALSAYGHADAEALVPLVFAVVFTTVSAHGLSMRPLGRALGLAAGPEEGVLMVGATHWSTGLARVLRDLGLPVLLVDTNPHHLKEARSHELPAFTGEILSDYAVQSLDLARYEHLIAATDNDAYNALVASHFAPELGRGRVFQLAHHGEDDPTRVRRAARGRVLLNTELDSDELERRWRDGWRFRILALDDAAAIEDVRQSQDVISVAAVTRDGSIAFRVAGEELALAQDQTVVLFAAPSVDLGASASAADQREELKEAAA